MSVVFSAHGLSKSYLMGDVTVTALDGVDLQLAPGELVVILGPSGSGKSTLLNILGGLDKPTSGDVVFADHVLTDITDAELTRFRRDHVGFVFQFFNLLPGLTAVENVQIVTDIARNPLPALEALQMVGLGNRAHHFPAQLSGGEQQRVAIARAIAKRPDVLLCDEPTGSLDFETGKRVLEVLTQVNREAGMLTVIVTHNAAIGRMANRVLRMRSGCIVEQEFNAVPVGPSGIEW